MENYKYRAIVNKTRTIMANDITTLKRLASRAANENYFVADSMTVFVSPDNSFHPVERLYFIRINKIAPNNTITRGKWR
jgi:hypothetical protein